MSETSYGAWAPLRNMDLCLRTMHALISAQDGAQRMGVFYGLSGWGKTTAAAYTTAATGAVYVHARAIWTHRSFLEALARELGIVRIHKTASKMQDQIIEHLQAEQRPIVLDEMDYLVKKMMVDVLRDIYDATTVPILMIGMEALPAKLKEWEQFDNRILMTTPAQPADQGDGRKLRDLYCRRVKIADDLVDYFTERCHGVTRRIVTNLHHAETLAIDELDRLELDRAAWGNRNVATGELMTRRAGSLR